MAILMPRLVHAWNVFPKAKESLPESPSTIAKRFFYDELVFEPRAVRFLVESFGESQILVGTDYPYPWTKTAADLVLNTPGLSDDDRLAILGGTAAKLLGIKTS